MITASPSKEVPLCRLRRSGLTRTAVVPLTTGRTVPLLRGETATVSRFQYWADGRRRGNGGQGCGGRVGWKRFR